jgi:hypothetical protein
MQNLLNRVVTWSNNRQLNSVASCTKHQSGYVIVTGIKCHKNRHISLDILHFNLVRQVLSRQACWDTECLPAVHCFKLISTGLFQFILISPNVLMDISSVCTVTGINFGWMYEGVSKRFRSESITKYTLTTINTHREATKMVMAAKLTRLTHRVAIQLHLVAESCTICGSPSRRPAWKLLDTCKIGILLRRLTNKVGRHQYFFYNETLSKALFLVILISGTGNPSVL